MISANITQTTSNHDGFVIPTNLGVGQARQVALVRAEVTGQVRAAKFVVE